MPETQLLCRKRTALGAAHTRIDMAVDDIVNDTACRAEHKSP